MNQESNLFNPLDLEMSRSTFHYSPTYTGTCTAGTLIPSLAFEVLPGDSIKMGLNSLFKMATPRYPTMDNLYVDISFFFVPNKLVLGRRYGAPSLLEGNQSWKAIIGAQDNMINMPIPASGLRLPSLYVPNGAKVFPNSLLDHFGYPYDIGGFKTLKDPFGNQNVRWNALPILSYFAVYNENYRDPNVDDCITWQFTGADEIQPSGYSLVCLPTPWVNRNRFTSYTGNYKVVNALSTSDDQAAAAPQCSYWFPFHTCRFHSYLGSALPWPQRNTDGVEIPLGDKAPVMALDDPHIETGDDGFPLIMQSLDAANEAQGFIAAGYPMASTSSSTGYVGYNNATGTPVSGVTLTPANLWTDLSQATGANVNMLRACIAKQRWFEHLARGGNRYDELKYSLLGVRGADALSDKPIYLGGKRIPLRIDMVASTNGASSGEIGKLGAFSHTNDSGNYFYHSFDDWGTLLCVFTIRAHTSAANAVKRSFVRRNRDDYYFPTFAHLGEQQVALSEAGVVADGALGFQQAWEEYRFEMDMPTGQFRPGNTLAYMTYTEDFNSMFGSSMTLANYLNASYQIQAIDNTLVTKSYASADGYQFIYQLNFDFTARRCLPTYSIPGLMDHF